MKTRVRNKKVFLKKKRLFCAKIKKERFFSQKFFGRSLIFGSRGKDRFLDTRGGAFRPIPPPSPMCGWEDWEDIRTYYL